MSERPDPDAETENLGDATTEGDAGADTVEGGEGNDAVEGDED